MRRPRAPPRKRSASHRCWRPRPRPPRSPATTAATFARRAAHADVAARLVDALPDAAAVARLDAFSRLAFAELFLERYDESVRHAERGIGLARASGRGLYLPQMVHAQATSNVFRGRLGDAIESEERAVEAALLTGVPHSITWALMCCAYAHLWHDATVTLGIGKEAVQLSRELPPSATGTMAAAVYAAALAQTGEHERCVRELLDAGRGPDLVAITISWRPFFLDLLTRSQLACGRLDAADEAADGISSATASSFAGVRPARTTRANARATAPPTDPARP